MKSDLLNKLLKNNEVRITPLRQDILSILAHCKKPIGAYDILGKLRQKRPNAEPPTVYRVLDFLVEAKLIHRVEKQNAYVCCSHHKNIHKTILFLCNKCHNTFEFEDETISDAISRFSKRQSIKIDDALIEMKGLCKNCN